MTVLYFDNDARGIPALGMHAVRVDDGAPIVTASAFRRFIAAWAANDPNGTWDVSGIAEGDGVLVYDDEVGRHLFPVVGVTDGAGPLYRLPADWGWIE